MASGCSQGPCTLARNTSGAPVTQKRAWMQRLVSNRRSSFSPGAISTPLTVVDAGPADATAGPAPARWAPLAALAPLDANGLLAAAAADALAAMGPRAAAGTAPWLVAAAGATPAAGATLAAADDASS